MTGPGWRPCGAWLGDVGGKPEVPLEPITYVSRQLGHRDASITLRVYGHWLPDGSREKLVNLLDARIHPHPRRIRTC